MCPRRALRMVSVSGPRPEMTAREALEFAFVWPPGLPLLPCCVTCGEYIRRRALIAHMDQRHPGWLQTWNGMLREHGIVA